MTDIYRLSARGGVTAYEIAHKITNEPFPLPSRHNPEIDERLDHLVLTALFKNGAERYASAGEMKQALEEYLAPTVDTEPVPAGGKGTLDFLLRRMRHKSNFPALSQTISTNNRIASDNDGSVQTLSAVLLKDFSLTNKLLRLVNSATYGQFGGSIAHSWNLPVKIIASMRHVSELKTIKPASPTDRLKLVANLATALCRVTSETPIACKTAERGCRIQFCAKQVMPWEGAATWKGGSRWRRACAALSVTNGASAIARDPTQDLLHLADILTALRAVSGQRARSCAIDKPFP